MASLKFYLKDSKAEKTNIYFFFNYGAFKLVDGKKKYIPLKYYINESINPQYWNSKAGRAKQDRRFKQYPEFNARLQDIEDKTLSLLRQMLNDGETINNEVLKTKLDVIIKPYKDQTNNSVEMEFLDFFRYYLETSDIKPSTRKSQKQTLRILEEYESEKKIKLTYDKIDIDFHSNFIQWLKSKDYATNTIGDRIKVVKSIMRASHERGLHNNVDYQKKSFVKPNAETLSIYLNEKELERLYKLDLSNNSKLSDVRDWFLLASYTGLRFSDFSRLSKENITDNITIKTQKTGATVVIPLHTYVKSILEKHNYKLPKVISNQKFNKYIKEACELAKIDEGVLIEETKDNLTVSKLEKKHSLVTAHTARRSFATNAYLSGVPSISIMKITGHKTEKVFMNYIKVSEKENADKLQLHPFFNKMIAK